MGGQNLLDTRNQPFESVIGPTNVSQLGVKWVFATGGGVPATPAVLNGLVYFPDLAGNFYALNASNGAVVWSHRVSDWTGLPGDRARDDPAVAGNSLFFGDQGGTFAKFINGKLSGPGARLIAVNKNTGAPLWVTQVESFAAAGITSSPVVYNGIVYVGVAAPLEEGALARNSTYHCCSFRGSVVAVNQLTGRILWKTYDMPSSPSNPGGYSGGPIWGSTPVVDTYRGSLYVGTGNNYAVPPDVESCIAAAQLMGEPGWVCNPFDNYAHDYFDSIIALNLNTGTIKWVTRLSGYDAWNEGCALMLDACPSPKGTDADFSAGPNLFKALINGNTIDILGDSQKSGLYFALNPSNGKIRWTTRVGPHLSIEWGNATDGQRVYVPFGNEDHITYKLRPSGVQTNGGSWSALDAGTGRLLWQTATPGVCTTPAGANVGCMAEGAATVGNGVVYVGSFDPNAAAPTMFGLDASTGQILWSFASGRVVHSGPAIVGDTLYWGSGYSAKVAGNMYAFTLPGS
jgi:polyvinyl alcohol dehydrogenase (cytochrome)